MGKTSNFGQILLLAFAKLVVLKSRFQKTLKWFFHSIRITSRSFQGLKMTLEVYNTESDKTIGKRQSLDL